MLREVISKESRPVDGGAEGHKFARCLAITTTAAARGARISHHDFEIMLEAAILDAGALADTGADARRPSHGLQSYLAGQRGRHFLANICSSTVVGTQQSVRDRDSLGYMLRILLGRMMDEGVVPSHKFISDAFWALVGDGDLFAAAALGRATRSRYIRSALLAHASKASHGEVCLQVLEDIMREGFKPDRNKMSLVLSACTSDLVRPGNLFAAERFLFLAMALDRHQGNAKAALADCEACEAWGLRQGELGAVARSRANDEDAAGNLLGIAAAEAEVAAAVGYGEAGSLLASLSGKEVDTLGRRRLLEDAHLARSEQCTVQLEYNRHKLRLEISRQALTVRSLKSRLEHVCGVPAAEQLLFCNGSLSDQDTSFVGHGDTLLLLRQAGAGAEGEGRARHWMLSRQMLLSLQKLLGLCWKAKHYPGVQEEAAAVASTSHQRESRG